MNDEDNLLNVKNLVAINQVKTAISFLSKNFGQSELGNQILLVSSRFHELENLRLNNLIKFEDYLLESNKLRLSILELCDKISIKNEPTGSELNELIQLLQYRAQKINEIFDSIDSKTAINTSTLKKFFRTSDNINSSDKAITILNLKKQFNDLQERHIDALKAKNFILANDIGFDIHELLFSLKFSKIAKFGLFASNVEKTFANKLSPIISNMNLEETFDEIWSYWDYSTKKEGWKIKIGVDTIKQLLSNNSV